MTVSTTSPVAVSKTDYCEQCSRCGLVWIGVALLALSAVALYFAVDMPSMMGTRTVCVIISYGSLALSLPLITAMIMSWKRDQEVEERLRSWKKV